MARFEPALAAVLLREGGFVNHPADRGGATNMGITLATLSQFRGRTASVADVQSLKREEASRIYRRNYWDALKLDDIASQALAEMLFDQAVNAGVRAAARRAQACVNRLVPANQKLVEDGQFGSKSVAAVNQLPARELALAFVKATQLAYAEMVVARGTQAVFLVGWLRRSHELLDQALSESAPARAAAPATSTRRRAGGRAAA
ncbi:MAG: hypothetical protein IT285_14050 [Bdellovibrionales bacterium]|nr:hypothetical protein [Bdellovibrionales bacterium]